MITPIANFHHSKLPVPGALGHIVGHLLLIQIAGALSVTIPSVTMCCLTAWVSTLYTPDGVPDTSTPTAINSPTEKIYDIAWLPDGRLAIAAEGDPESDSLLGHFFSCSDPCAPQVYLWSEQTLLQVTSNDSGGLVVDVHDNGSMVVSDFDGLRIWGMTVFDSSLQPVFQSDGPHTISRWSADGNLAYCEGDDLLVWNGQGTKQLSSRTTSRWLMASSPPMLCSTG